MGARGAPIDSIGDWLCLAPPVKRAAHWRKGRSARELATAWLRPGRPALPEELAVLLVSNPLTTFFASGLARPEAELVLDEHEGNTRNADLLLHGTAAGGNVLITIEAKADESYGPYVHEALAGVAGKSASKLPDRIRALSELLFGPEGEPGDPLRYQLLHGLGATVLEALRTQADVAVFVIHVFRTPETSDAKHELNAADLRSFMARFAAEDIVPDRLRRVTVAGAPKLPVFVGLVTTDTRQAPC